jgi:hypothetical protein
MIALELAFDSAKLWIDPCKVQAIVSQKIPNPNKTAEMVEVYRIYLDGIVFTVKDTSMHQIIGGQLCK